MISRFHIIKRGYIPLVLFMKGDPETPTHDIWNQTPKRKTSRSCINDHICTLEKIKMLTQTYFDLINAEFIKGVTWTEYAWCGRKLFIGVIYWPPDVS